MALGPFFVAQKLTEISGPRGVALLMRHGQTAWNRQGPVMGRNPVELSDQGRAQAQAAARSAIPPKPDLILTSPLVRARPSAQIACAELVAPVATCQDPSPPQPLSSPRER